MAKEKKRGQGSAPKFSKRRKPMAKKKRNVIPGNFKENNPEILETSNPGDFPKKRRGEP